MPTLPQGPPPLRSRPFAVDTPAGLARPDVVGRSPFPTPWSDAVVYAAGVLRPTGAVLVGLVCGGLFGFQAFRVGLTAAWIVGPPVFGAVAALVFIGLYKLQPHDPPEAFRSHRAAER